MFLLKSANCVKIFQKNEYQMLKANIVTSTVVENWYQIRKHLLMFFVKKKIELQISKNRQILLNITCKLLSKMLTQLRDPKWEQCLVFFGISHIVGSQGLCFSSKNFYIFAMLSFIHDKRPKMLSNLAPTFYPCRCYNISL